MTAKRLTLSSVASTSPIACIAECTNMGTPHVERLVSQYLRENAKAPFVDKQYRMNGQIYSDLTSVSGRLVYHALSRMLNVRIRILQNAPNGLVMKEYPIPEPEVSFIANITHWIYEHHIDGVTMYFQLHNA